jgi:hypothetical protein
MNKNKNGVKHSTSAQLVNESQFFLFLKTLSLEKNSRSIWPLQGLVKLPNSSFQPYTGGSRTLFKKIINQELGLRGQ